MVNVVWVRWYEMYGVSDGAIIPSDDHYNYQWYNKGDLNLVQLREIIEMDIEDCVYGDEPSTRTIRWDFVDKPPKEYIESQLKYYNNLNDHAVSMIKYYKGLEEVE